MLQRKIELKILELLKKRRKGMQRSDLEVSLGVAHQVLYAALDSLERHGEIFAVVKNGHSTRYTTMPPSAPRLYERPERLLALGAMYLGFSSDEVRGKAQSKTICSVRHALIHAIKRLTSASWQEIGNAFLRHHTTMINAWYSADRTLSDKVYNHLLEVCGNDNRGESGRIRVGPASGGGGVSQG